ncbi:MAG TPA: hypothetical protein VFV20_03040 [Candidatus Limnocylindria bacterium]|nr:hypothetical protein [Candidatus Limnocylindria bacterium]
MIAGVTLLARRDPVLAGWVSVFPTATSLALVWLAIDRTPEARMADFTGGVIAGLLPSVSILIAFAVLLRLNVPFSVTAVAVVGLWLVLTLVVRQLGFFVT